MATLSFALSVVGCTGVHEADGDDVCTEIAFSVSNHVYTCTGDPDEANAAYETFAERYACIASKDEGLSEDCAIAVRALSCELTDALGDDYGQWLMHADDDCARSISKQNGDPLDPKEEVDGGV